MELGVGARLSDAMRYVSGLHCHASLLAAIAPLALATASPAGALTLSSPAFENGEPIPAAHACTAANDSPPLRWSDVPEGTEAFALVVEDLDAPGGGFVHWVLYDVGAAARELPAGVPPIGRGEGGMKRGSGDFQNPAYGGPCPPAGSPHRYVFRLYALDAPTGLAPGASRKDLMAAIRSHVLAEASLTGTFAR